MIQCRRRQCSNRYVVSHANSPIDNVSWGTVFMKEIAPEQNEIHLVVSSDFQNLLECPEAVFPSQLKGAGDREGGRVCERMSVCASAC